METPHRDGAAGCGEAMTITTIIASRVKELRGAARLSGADMAAAMHEQGIGWNRTTVAKLETGRRESVTVQELLALAVALNVPPVWLLADPTSPHPVHIADGVDLDPWSAIMWMVGAQALTDPPGSTWPSASGPLAWAWQAVAIARQMDEAAWFRAAGFQYFTVAGGVEHDQQDVDVAERVDRQSFARLVPLLDALRTAGLPVPRMPATVTVRARELAVDLPGVGN